MANVKAPLKGVANQVEKATEVGLIKEFNKTVTGEAKRASDNFFEQLLGVDLTSEKKAEQPQKETVGLKGQLETVIFSRSESVTIASFEKGKAKTPEKKPAISAAIEYHDAVLDGKKFSQQEMHEVSQKVNDIMIELRKLISSSKVLQMEFAEVAVEQRPANVGQYHINFFEWMLSVIKIARQKVEDSGAWLSTIQSKGGKKKNGYWGMFKKHGTSFGMSNERSVATQVG